MVAAAQESKRLGLCHKSLIAVPNYLTEQWAEEYIRLYPNANILVAKKKDFEKENRKKFCAKISTGNYDAVIIGHSQLIKIPLSIERQQETIREEIEKITENLVRAKEERLERFTIKQMEKTKKTLQTRLEKLNNQEIKDDVVNFEELGIDRLFIDESHAFKNCFISTKMRNVAGISQSESQKAFDLYLKCKYLNEKTDYRGVIFASGTPVSNSLTELFIVQRYLQDNRLKESGLEHFDNWASTFGETTTSVELSPAGTGYRAKTRFAKFYNLPELMSMFKEVADIKTADTLNLPTPTPHYENIMLKPTEHQKEMIASLAKRAEKVKNREVSIEEDNMLLITNDGRKIALDQRLINPLLPDSEHNKSTACANKLFEIWQKTADKRLTQIVFCDLSTPKKGEFNVYDDIKEKLISKGVPTEEIAFIHNYNTEVKKQKLFEKVRNGEVRFIFGSTSKLGVGANIQNKLVALHHLDIGWRPSDETQRAGRIIRQGNENSDVYIYRYLTESSFDSYSYQILENKQRFCAQIMTSKSPVRVAKDVDEMTLSYAEIKSLATGNPKIIERCNLEIEVNKLKLLRSNYLNQKYELEDKLTQDYPRKREYMKERIKGLKDDILLMNDNTIKNDKGFSIMKINGVAYAEKDKAGKMILENIKALKDNNCRTIGEYRGFKMQLYYDSFYNKHFMKLNGSISHTVELGGDVMGNITRLNNALNSLETRLTSYEEKLKNLDLQVKNAEEQIAIPFDKEKELIEKTKRLNQLDAELRLDTAEESEKNHQEKEEQKVSDEYLKKQNLNTRVFQPAM